MKEKRFLFIFLIVLIFSFKPINISAAPVISNVSYYSDIGKYEKYEITFDVQNTIATNFQLPYDASPPTGITAGVGISVDGLFLKPGESNWNSATVQPGFWHENFSMALNDTAHAGSFQKKPDWIYAEGSERWKIRFAPDIEGVWKFKIRAADASGEVLSGEMSFTVISSSKKGFIRVSQTDTRYFEFDNGSVFIPAGLSLITQGITDTTLSRLWNNPWQAKVVENKLNLFRPWITPWQNMPIYGGYGEDRHSYFNYITLAVDTINGASNIHSGRYAYKKIGGGTTYGDTTQFINPNQPVKPNTKYKFTGWIKTVGLTGTGDAGARLYAPYETLYCSVRVNFPPAYGGWIDTTASFKLTGNNDWTHVELTFTTKSNSLWMYMGGWQGNATSGTAYFDDLSLKEVINDSTLGPEQFDKGDMEFHEHFSQRESYRFDKLLEWAEQNGIYFKVSIEEKKEESYLRIKTDGTTDDFPPDTSFVETNYSGRALGNTPLKWYEKAYWRYLIARWGYSTAVHSWEQFNEQEYNSTVYQLTKEFSQYMHQNDPKRHLVTTSFEKDFPSSEFWANTTYSEIDYADFHKYLNPFADLTGYAFWGTFFEKVNISVETASANVYGGQGYSIKIPFGKTPYNQGGNKISLNIKGQGTWTIKYLMKRDNLQGTVDGNGLLRGGLYYYLDVGNNRIPNAPSKSEFNANISPGTYDWTQFSGTFQLNDNNVRFFSFVFVSDDYQSGNVWIDNVELIDPNGNSIYINGEFDLYSKKSDDLAMYISESALTLGNIGKPIIWGETGMLDSTCYSSTGVKLSTDPESSELKLDTAGVGFHNFVWSHINPSGVSVLYWHHMTEIFDKGWIKHFKPYVLFMEGIPLNNGHYKDTNASVSDINIRAWGQKDTTNNRAHLWIQNKQHTWRNAVSNKTVNPITSGSITIPNMNNVNYLIEWWDTYSTTGIAFRKGKAAVTGGNLNLSLPNSLTTDVAVKVAPLLGSIPGTLDWTGESGYTNSGVNPESGYAYTNFIFRIKYTDPNNYYPAYVNLLLDKNGDGDYTDSGEVISMEEADTTDKSFVDGKIYTKTITIPYTPNGKNISYKFQAFDGISFASGVPTTAINLPDLFIDLALSISSGEVNLNQVNLSAFSTPSSITVNNTSDGSATFTLQITNPAAKGSGWRADTTLGKDVYILRTLFTGANETPAIEDFKDDDIITNDKKTASSADFGDSKFSANGANVPARSSVKLWLLMKSPLASNYQQEENITITIGVIEAP